MRPEAKPDRLEKIVRFVCGALVGRSCGIWAAAGTAWTVGETVGSMAAGAMIFGACAVIFGDRFWHGLLRGWGGW